MSERSHGSTAETINLMVHRVLAVGLAISATLMLAGVAAGLMQDHSLPRVVLGVGAARPRGAPNKTDRLLSLGLFALILTPFLRVAGSIAVFTKERDWRYVGVTVFVLAIMVASLWLGQV
jgi:uncharacterized membrane protein